MQIGQRAQTPVVHTIELIDWALGGPRPLALETTSTTGKVA
jgi:glycolate oxidase iron-sulfur subunit